MKIFKTKILTDRQKEEINALWNSEYPAKLKAENHEFYGWVIDHDMDVKLNGEHYKSPMPFYLKHDFEILSEQRIDSEMIRAVLIRYSSQKNGLKLRAPMNE
jgi:hypothetical protein